MGASTLTFIVEAAWALSCKLDEGLMMITYSIVFTIDEQGGMSEIEVPLVV